MERRLDELGAFAHYCYNEIFARPTRLRRAGVWPMRTGLFVSLLVALAARAWAADGFEFVVIGDTRPRFESESFRTFETLIPKVNEVKPAFVVNLGDLIYGYGLLSKEKQWDKYQQVIKAIQAPYYQVPGNHDAYSKEARRIYRCRFGKSYAPFDYGACHCVLLDNTEQGRWGYLGPAEVDWLKADLRETRAQSVFVFLHFPVWEPERVAAKYHEFWVQTLHPLFMASRVRAVFGGHLHSYGPTREIDGIHYYITGGGGAELRPDYRKSGGVHHFVKVQVSGDTYDLRVVTEHGELKDAEADLLGGLAFADKNCSNIGLTPGSRDLRAGVNCSVALTNPYLEPLGGEAEWQFESSAVTVEPRRAALRIPPLGTQHLRFTLKSLEDAVSPKAPPRLEFDLVSGKRHHRFYREVLLLRELLTRYRPAPPALDGRFDDWRDVPPLDLGENTKRRTQLRALHDGKNLYLAVSVPAVEPDERTESALSDDLRIGLADRSSNTDFGTDLIRLGFTCTGSGVEARDRTPGRKAGATVPALKSACRREGDRMNFEIGIPSGLLKPLELGPEHRLILNLAFPVPEGEADAQEPTDPSLNSYAYQVRYGGDPLVPVQFIGLLLERKR